MRVTACPFGFFGGDCQYSCHCYNQSTCNVISGVCEYPYCDPQYWGPSCQLRKSSFNRIYALKLDARVLADDFIEAQSSSIPIESCVLSFSRCQAWSTKNYSYDLLLYFIVNKTKILRLIFLEAIPNRKHCWTLAGLPKLISPPIVNATCTTLLVKWAAWTQNTDIGDPPVVSYL